MARINDLAAAYFGKSRLENSMIGGSQTRTETGIAVTDSDNGSVYVVLGNETIPSMTLDGTEGDNSAKMATTTSVKKGDTVIVTLVGNEGTKTPTVTGVVGRGDEVVAAVEEVAEDAAAAAEAASGYVLFESSSADGTPIGTGGTLTDDISNYRYAKVFYNAYQMRGSIREKHRCSAEVLIDNYSWADVFLDNGLAVPGMTNLTNVTLEFAYIKLSGTAWSAARNVFHGAQITVASDGTVTLTQGCHICVERIIGYK